MHKITHYRMPKLKGSILFIPSIIIIGLEFKLLIFDMYGESGTTTLNSNQYWALALPVFFLSFFVSLLIMWIGYTMIVTKEPLRLTYDSAYEEAAEAVASRTND